MCAQEADNRAANRVRLCCGLAMLGMTLAAAATWAQDAPVPKKYQVLYAGIERQLGQFEAKIPPPRHVSAPLRGALLASSPCELPPALNAESRRRATQQELDGFQRAGVELVVLDVCYPLLSPAFHDPRLVLEHYANLANEVRRRDLRLLVRHRALPASHGAIVASGHYVRMGKQHFLRGRYDELKSIALAIQPDYLTVLASPRDDSVNLKLTAADWRRYLQQAASGLQQELGDLTPPLGAGLALWEDVKLLDTFAAVTGIDYVDVRAQLPVLASPTLLQRLIDWPERIRSIDAGKRVLVSEAWLYKAAPTDPFRGKLDPSVLARGAYSFWSPLDIRFLQDVMRIARGHGIEAVAAAQPRYLFAYLDFFDPITFRASPRLLMELAERKAEQAMREDALSATGRAFGML